MDLFLFERSLSSSHVKMCVFDLLCNFFYSFPFWKPVQVKVYLQNELQLKGQVVSVTDTNSTSLHTVANFVSTLQDPCKSCKKKKKKETGKKWHWHTTKI